MFPIDATVYVFPATAMVSGIIISPLQSEPLDTTAFWVDVS